MASSPPEISQTFLLEDEDTSTSQKSNNKKPSRIWSSVAKKSSSHHTQTGDTTTPSAFRQRFLHALQFYCDTPSLVLNSDLPADLVEFVTSQAYPVEALGVILELKRGANSNPKSTPRVAELSRKLAESWMSAESCAEALGSLSLGDEVPGVIAETSSLHRLVFSISDNFHIPSQEFQIFLLSQTILAIQALVYGVKDKNYEGTIRSQVLGGFLDRIFLRFHSDAEQFVSQSQTARSKNKGEKDDDKREPFINFVQQLGIICHEDFIARRLLSRILIGLGNQAAFKFAKTIFFIGIRESCPASAIFFPHTTFFTSPTWNNTLMSSIPTKTGTKSPLFWTNWAFFIYSTAPSITTVWETSVTSWQALCSSSVVTAPILLPATYPLVALGREIKVHHGEKSATILLSAVKVFDSVAKCLDSTDEGKKACGMALAQVMGDLHTFNNKSKNPVSSDNASSSEEPKQLKFTSSHPIFQELVTFYENGFRKENAQSNNNSSLPEYAKKIQVLDSDDDDDDDSESEIQNNETSFCVDEEDPPIDERILDYRSKKGKLPQYFSEFIEILVEGGSQGQSGNEAEVEALKFYCIMRIPLLLSAGIRIDSNMAESLVKCLIDFEAASVIEVPIIFTLYEISFLHPVPLFETLAKTAFDNDHYTSGHRMILLQRISEIIQLLSKSKCFSCHDENLTLHRSELISIGPDFFKKYVNDKKKLRVCSECGRKTVNEKTGACTSQQPEPNQDLSSWRAIVDRRIASKTRYFFTPHRKTPIILQDDYSSKLVPIIWASIANRVLFRVSFFMDEEERKVRGAPNDALLAQMFRLLARILLGLGGSTCPHLGSIAGQVSHLSSAFATHPDATVRQSVFALVAVILTISDGASYIVEAVSGGSNIFETLKFLRNRETHSSNKDLLDHTIAFLAQAATQDYRLHFPNSSSGGGEEEKAYGKLRFLPDANNL